MVISSIVDIVGLIYFMRIHNVQCISGINIYTFTDSRSKPEYGPMFQVGKYNNTWFFFPEMQPIDRFTATLTFNYISKNYNL
jgi:hypothetical protein